MKKIIYLLVGITALLLLILMLIPTLIDTNQFRPLIQSKLEQTLQRKVSFDRLQLSTFPSLTLKINNLRVQDSRLPSGIDLLYSPSVEITIDPFSYLQGVPEVESIQIASPTIHLNSQVLKMREDRTTSPGAAENKTGSIGIMKKLDLQLNEMSVNFWDESSSSQPAFKIQNIRARFWDPNPPEGNPFLVSQGELSLDGTTISSNRLSVPLLVQSGLARLSQNRLLIEQVKAKLENSIFEGKIQIESFLEPIVRFELRCPELRLENIENWRTLAQEAVSAAPLGSSPANSATADIQGTIGVERLGIGPRFAEQVAMQVRWEGNALLISRLQGQIFKGQLLSSGRIDLSPKLPEYALKVEIQKADLSDLLAQSAGKPRMEGLLNLVGDLKGAGLDFHQDQAIQNLRATGRFSIQKGKINTFELSEKLKFLTSLTQIASGDDQISSDITVQSDYQFTGREVKSRSMEVRTGLLTLILDGSFTPQGFMDYQVQPKVQRPSQGQESLFGAILGVVSGAVQNAAPFRVRGTLDNLEIIL